MKIWIRFLKRLSPPPSDLCFIRLKSVEDWYIAGIGWCEAKPMRPRLSKVLMALREKKMNSPKLLYPVSIPIPIKIRHAPIRSARRANRYVCNYLSWLIINCVPTRNNAPPITRIRIAVFSWPHYTGGKWLKKKKELALVRTWKHVSVSRNAALFAELHLCARNYSTHSSRFTSPHWRRYTD